MCPYFISGVSKKIGILNNVLIKWYDLTTTLNIHNVVLIVSIQFMLVLFILKSSFNLSCI